CLKRCSPSLSFGRSSRGRVLIIDILGCQRCFSPNGCLFSLDIISGASIKTLRGHFNWLCARFRLTGKMPVGPIAKMVVLRRGLAELAPPACAFAHCSSSMQLRARSGREDESESDRQVNRPYLLEARGLCRSCGGRGSGRGAAEWGGEA